ncbi:hypothetical protein [Rubricoccus marinus]|nr:hypothetical protein [Rubricoccus marinus]
MQYINVVEAAASLGFSFESSLLVAPEAMRIRLGEPKEPWGDVRWYSYGRDIGRLSRWLGRSALGRASRTVDHVRMFAQLLPPDLKGGRLVLGNILDRRLRHVANALDPAELVLIDDGTATIVVAQRLRDQPIQSVLARVVEKGLRLDTRYPTRGTLFTIYDVDLPPSWTLRHNEYSVLGAKLRSVTTANEALIIGGPYVDYGWIDLDDYITHLEGIQEWARTPITYVPHGKESASVIAAIESALGCRTWRPPEALEVALAHRGVVPRHVIGFYSSFLPNAAMLFGGRCDVLALDIAFPYMPEAIRPGIEDVYDYLRMNVQLPNFAVVTSEALHTRPAHIGIVAEEPNRATLQSSGGKK